VAFPQAEVEDLDAPLPGDEEVRGLQVAMDNPLLVRGPEAAGELESVVDGLSNRDGTSSDSDTT
jgi:hypothetical protein